MKLSKETLARLEADLANAKSYEDLMGKNGAIKKLLKQALETMLDAELTEHLGYEKHSSQGDHSGNSRNGTTPKTIKTDTDTITLAVPRDRNSAFEPIVVKKYQRTLGPIEDRMISLYARGMSTRDIQAHIEEIYGLEVSPQTVSTITDHIHALVEQWQARPLEELYPIVFFDAIHFKVRDNGVVKVKAAYTCLGIDTHGQKDMLGIWVGEAEGAAFWLSILTELRNRGVKDILIACVDGLKGFPDAIGTIFPHADVQLCIIHQIRNSLRYIVFKDQKEFMHDLRAVYYAPTEQKAAFELTQLEQRWGTKYPIVIRSWKTNWAMLSSYFKYPEEIRTVMYTTNAVEAVHRQFRKITKSKAAFPSNESLTKLLFLVYRNMQKKWTVPIKHWGCIISQFSIIFGERLSKFLEP
jgi:transposase-like protein